MKEPTADPEAADAGRAPAPPTSAAPLARVAVPRGLLWALALATVLLTLAGWIALSDERRDTSVPVEFLSSPGQPRPAPLPGTPGGNLDLTGQPAPDTHYTTLDGEHASLADYRGRPVVVNFWQSGCAACVIEMPDINRVFASYGDRVRFVGIAVTDTVDNARALVDRTGVRYPIGLDHHGEVGRAFGLITLPTTVLLDENGVVVHTSPSRALSADELTTLVEEKLVPR